MSGWQKTFQRNWLYMLAATLLSVLFWVAVSADTVSQRLIPAELVIINGDRRYIQTGQQPERETVDVLFTGREGAMLALSVARPQIYVSLDSVESETLEIELDPSMVSGRGGRELGETRAVSVRPNRFILRFEPRAQKVVRVAPRVALSFADGYMMADSVRVQPGVVSIEGPKSAVDSIESVSTEHVTRQLLRESIDLEVPLEEPDPDRFIELSALSVRVRVTVERRTERVFPGIPVGAPGVDISRIRLEPSLVDIKIIGPQSAVDAVRPEALLPSVVVRDDSDYGNMLSIELPQPGAFLRVLLEPDSTRVTRIDGTG